MTKLAAERFTANEIMQYVFNGVSITGSPGLKVAIGTLIDIGMQPNEADQIEKLVMAYVIGGLRPILQEYMLRTSPDKSMGSIHVVCVPAPDAYLGVRFVKPDFELTYKFKAVQNMRKDATRGLRSFMYVHPKRFLRSSRSIN